MSLQNVGASGWSMGTAPGSTLTDAAGTSHWQYLAATTNGMLHSTSLFVDEVLIQRNLAAPLCWQFDPSTNYINPVTVNCDGSTSRLYLRIYI